MHTIATNFHKVRHHAVFDTSHDSELGIRLAITCNVELMEFLTKNFYLTEKLDMTDV